MSAVERILGEDQDRGDVLERRQDGPCDIRLACYQVGLPGLIW
jgi:hypothetical protein